MGNEQEYRSTLVLLEAAWGAQELVYIVNYGLRRVSNMPHEKSRIVFFFFFVGLFARKHDHACGYTEKQWTGKTRA